MLANPNGLFHRRTLTAGLLEKPVCGLLVQIRQCGKAVMAVDEPKFAFVAHGERWIGKAAMLKKILERFAVLQLLSFAGDRIRPRS
jgi:hypothetical protein